MNDLETSPTESIIARPSSITRLTSCSLHTLLIQFHPPNQMVGEEESRMSSSPEERQDPLDRPEPLLTSTPLLDKGEVSSILCPDAIEQVCDRKGMI